MAAVASSSKRRRGNSGPTSTESLVREIGRLTLANSAAIRQLKPCSVRTCLIDPTNSYALLAKSTGKAYSDMGRDKRPPNCPPYSFIFHALLKQLASDPSVNLHSRELLFECLKQCPTPADANKVVRVCRFSRCFPGTEASLWRFELALEPKYSALSDVFCQTIMGSSGHECFGPAPRAPLERSVASALGLSSNGQA